MENDKITDYTYSNLMEWFNEFEAHTKKKKEIISNTRHNIRLSKSFF